MIRPALAATLLTGLLGACAASDVTEESPSHDGPNEGLLRDFVDGKYDSAGHPLNAKVVDARVLQARPACGGATRDGVLELRQTCTIDLPMGAEAGLLTVNARLRVRQRPSSGTIVTIVAADGNGTKLGDEKLTVSRLRDMNRWVDLPINLENDEQVTHVTLTLAPGAVVDLQYVEVFPRQLGVVVSPGAGIYRDTDLITFELPKNKQIEKLEADGVDVKGRLESLVQQGRAKKTTTAFRTLIEVSAGDLLPGRGDVTELRVHSSGDTSRTQLRRTAVPCRFEGDPAGKKVLITGFQPFPADGWHENISAVAITALDSGQLRGAQVMRLVLPVEYDRAAATIADVIDRCQPSSVISFGQGGGEIALEEVAYNLQDTGELARGAADNRGIIRAAALIEGAAPATRETLLPLDKIEDALVAMGEAPQRSQDPGRYICNNVMFVDIGKMALRGRAGFIHLPYTTAFDATSRAHWGAVAAAAVQATVDAP